MGFWELETDDQMNGFFTLFNEISDARPPDTANDDNDDSAGGDDNKDPTTLTSTTTTTLWETFSIATAIGPTVDDGF